MAHSAVHEHPSALLDCAVDELDCGIEVGHKLLTLLWRNVRYGRLKTRRQLDKQNPKPVIKNASQLRLALSSTSMRRYGMGAAPVHNVTMIGCGSIVTTISHKHNAASMSCSGAPYAAHHAGLPAQKNSPSRARNSRRPAD